MESTPPVPVARRPTARVPLTPSGTIQLALALGLAGGYLDVVFMLGRQAFWNDPKYIWCGRDYPWSVPAGHASLLLIPGLILAAISRLRPGWITRRSGAWLLATLAIWSALLRLPITGAASLILAAGLGRLISKPIAAHGPDPKLRRWSLAGLLGLLVVLGAGSSGRQFVREARALAALPSTPRGARNVVLIVLDTVRARNLSLYGYPRETSPNLGRWARDGIRFNRALAPAPWTYPSHSSFFTGQWPYRLNSQWKFRLDTPDPTLAEHLAARGYQTAGFVANTNCCSYETGLDRGFIHYDDYALTLRTFFGRTVPGQWLLEHALYPGDFYARKWIGLQARDARAINGAFSRWLDGRRRDRPFFAYLNYYDAHSPYIPPPGSVARFGRPPRYPKDYHILMEYGEENYESITEPDVLMARDRYDDCIAFLDGQIGQVRDELSRRGLLEQTVVVITSDHGEEFGERGIFGHAKSVYLDEVAVPLIVLAPGVPAGRDVSEPVSLRDLPATVVDLLGLAADSPFPGRSLAAHWRRRTGAAPPETTPALSEIAHATAFQPQDRGGLKRQGVQMSLVARGRHYVRDGNGAEHLFDPIHDPYERTDLMNSEVGAREAGAFRKMLLEVLAAAPGSIEVERAYLRTYRQWLRSLVSEATSPGDPIAE